MVYISSSNNLIDIKRIRRVFSNCKLRIARYMHRLFVKSQLVKHSIFLIVRKQQVRKTHPNRQFIGINLVEHLGDIVASEPVIRYLRQQYPNAFLVWFVRRQYRELLIAHPDIDLVVPVACITEGILIQNLPILDRLIDLHINGKECSYCQIKLTNNGNPEITIDTFLSYGGLLQIFCESAGLPRLKDHPSIHIPDAVVLKVNRLNLPRKFVVIHCTASDEHRNWDKELWCVLVKQIIEQTGLHVIEVGLAPVVVNDSANYLSVCGQVSIMEMAEIISRANVFVGVESGPAHIANAMETSGVILLGPIYSFKRYLPYTGMYADLSSAHILYNENGIKHISVEEVYHSLLQKLNISAE